LPERKKNVVENSSPSQRQSLIQHRGGSRIWEGDSSVVWGTESALEPITSKGPVRSLHGTKSLRSRRFLANYTTFWQF